MKEIVTRSPEETQAYGRRLAASLGPGDCVGFDGELGSGKTCLIQGVCSGLRVEDVVTSPTFILINEYEGRTAEGGALPVFHFDLYRLGGEDELIDLGCDDYFYGTGLCLVEWASYAGDLLPEMSVRVTIAPVDETTRRLTVTGGRE